MNDDDVFTAARDDEPYTYECFAEYLALRRRAGQPLALRKIITPALDMMRYFTTPKPIPAYRHFTTMPIGRHEGFIASATSYLGPSQANDFSHLPFTASRARVEFLKMPPPRPPSRFIHARRYGHLQMMSYIDDILLFLPALLMPSDDSRRDNSGKILKG